jgi:UrcA family protein
MTMNTQTLPHLTLATITLALHLFGAAALSVGTQKLGAQAVSYRDLDLSRPADAAVLYSRIDRAAQEVCAPLGGAADAATKLRESCVDRAIAATLSKLNDANGGSNRRMAHSEHLAGVAAARTI